MTEACKVYANLCKNIGCDVYYWSTDHKIINTLPIEILNQKNIFVINTRVILKLVMVNQIGIIILLFLEKCIKEEEKILNNKQMMKYPTHI